MKKIINLIKSILGYFIVPYINIFLRANSIANYVKSLFKRDRTIYFSDHSGQKTLLIALFEKGVLRPDIIKLLKIAKSMGLFVIAVNSQKLEQKTIKECENLFDVYIERYNFGRDFGSYKCGFKYIFSHDIHYKAKRLVMLNDSVYYDSDRAQSFLQKMFDESALEVLGATENFEISYHLGSFAISFAKSITTNQFFIHFWKGYRNSDVRPIVIKRGEMGLSKVLQKIVSSTNQFGSLFNSVKVLKILKENPENILTYSQLSRKSDRVGWPRLNPKLIVEAFLQESLLNVGLHKKVQASNDEKEVIYKELEKISQNIHIVDTGGINAYLKKTDLDNESILKKFSDFQVSLYVQNSRFGSQIHQNHAVFLWMGLPLIKLDGLYRGMFDDSDILSLGTLLSPNNFNECYALLYSKPFGGDVLFGWKRVAFYRGLI